MQLEVAAIAPGNYNGVLCQREMRAGLRIRFRQEDAAPARGRGFDILHVKHEVREAFIEDARLHCERGLRRKHLGFERVECA